MTDTAPSASSWVSLEAFAAHRGCSLRTVYRMIERGQVQTHTVNGRALVAIDQAETVQGATLAAHDQATEARRAAELVHQVAQVAIERAEARAAQADRSASRWARLAAGLAAAAVTGLAATAWTVAEARGLRDSRDRADSQAVLAQARADAAQAALARQEAEADRLRADLQAVTMSQLTAAPGWSVVAAGPSR